MNWCRLLIHQTINKVPENEAHENIRKTISAYLSELGAKGIADVPTILNRIKGIEADRRSTGYPTTGDKANTSKRVNEKKLLLHM